MIKDWAGEAKVEQLDPMFRKEDVRRLEVAMNNTAAMHRRQSREHATHDLESVLNGQSTPTDTRGQRLPFQELHGDVKPAAVFPDLIELADVRVVEARGHSGLSLETL